MDHNIPHFSVINLPSATIGRDHREIHTTVGGYGFRFPISQVAIGVTPTSVGGRNPLCSLPIFVTLLVTAKRVVKGVGSYTFVNRLSLSNRVHPYANILPVLLGTHRRGVNSIFVPCTGGARTNIISKVSIFPTGAIFSIVHRLDNRTPVRPYFAPVRGLRASSRFLSFTSIGKRRSTGETLRVTTTNKRGYVVINPPNAKGSVLTGELPSVLPRVDFRRRLRAAGVCSVTNRLPTKIRLVAEQPFHDPRRAISTRKLANNKRAPHPNRVDLTRGNILFVSRFPRFSHHTGRTLHRPLRSNGIAVIHDTNAISCPSTVAIITTVGPYPYNCFNRPAQRYAYAPTTGGQCHSGVDNPVLSEVSVRVRISPISCRGLSSTRGDRDSTRVEGHIGTTHRVRHHQFRNAKVDYGTRVAPTVAHGFYILAGRTSRLLGVDFRGLKLSTETCSGLLHVSHAVTSLRNDRDVRFTRITRTIRCHDLSEGC